MVKIKILIDRLNIRIGKTEKMNSETSLKKLFQM